MNSEYDKLFMKNDQPHTIERKYVTIKIRKCSETIDGLDDYPRESWDEVAKKRN